MMPFGKRKLIAAVLEKDNLKMLAYEVAAGQLSRLFGGQITFSNDVVKETFIADPVKFSAQVKAALAQKPQVADISEANLFLPAEKSYIKSYPASDPIDGFVRSLPYFKEELIIDPQQGNKQHPSINNQIINHLAFEKKLVEDFERPFLESGKKVASISSVVLVLVEKYVQSGRYLLVIPLEKEVAVVVCDGGAVVDQASFPKDVFVGRLNEFRLGKNYSDIKNVFVLGIVDAAVLDKLRNEQQLTVTEIDKRDIYDLIVAAQVLGYRGQVSGTSKLPAGLPAVSVPRFGVPGLGGLFNKKWLFMAGAAVVGFVLVFGIFQGLGKLNSVKLPGVKKVTPILIVEKKSTPTATPTPVPSGKPADFKVRVLNGTKVTGEAGRAGEALKALGFDVVETKNATDSGFTETKLRVAKDVPNNIISQIKEALEKTYQSVTSEGFVDNEVKIEVIIGKKK